jgi:hypothetical protein
MEYKCKWALAVAVGSLGQAFFGLYRVVTLPFQVLSQVPPGQTIHVFVLAGAIGGLAMESVLLSVALGATAAYLGRGRALVLIVAATALALSLCLKPIGRSKINQVMSARHLTDN